MIRGLRLAKAIFSQLNYSPITILKLLIFLVLEDRVELPLPVYQTGVLNRYTTRGRIVYLVLDLDVESRVSGFSDRRFLPLKLIQLKLKK